jgi:hypothetical protein
MGVDEDIATDPFLYPNGHRPAPEKWFAIMKDSTFDFLHSFFFPLCTTVESGFS